MSHTREKLCEVEHFLAEMKHYQSSDQKKFKFSLNAFLSSSRSVRDHLETEFEYIPGFKAWYDQKKTEMKGDALKEFPRPKRNVPIQQKTVQLTGIHSATLTEHVHVSAHVSIVIKNPDGTEGGRSESKPGPAPDIVSTPPTTQ